MVIEFNKVIKRLNIGYEDNNKKRHIFTLHSFRRYLRTLISDLGHIDYAEWTLGHSSISTYWRKGEKEKYALFRKIEPHLLLLDQTSLQRRGADMQSKVDVLERENQVLIQNNTMVSDSVASLSDRLAQLTQEIEILKKQK
jgi:hypothetical protein